WRDAPAGDRALTCDALLGEPVRSRESTHGQRNDQPRDLPRRSPCARTVRGAPADHEGCADHADDGDSGDTMNDANEVTGTQRERIAPDVWHVLELLIARVKEGALDPEQVALPSTRTEGSSLLDELERTLWAEPSEAPAADPVFLDRLRRQ